MEKPLFLPQEATEAQRREIVNLAIASSEAQAGPVQPVGLALFERYIAGEITLATAYQEIVAHYQRQALQRN